MKSMRFIPDLKVWVFSLGFHNKFYKGKKELPFIYVKKFQREIIQPCYTTGTDFYSDNRQAFHEIIQNDGGWKGKYVLDYACGLGNWSIYFALTGAKKVKGFDISDTAIRRGRERVAVQGLREKIQLDVMNATRLAYPDNSFDIVIGKGVLHHVIKYSVMS